MENPRVILLAALLGLLVALPSLKSGYFLDDYFQRTVVLTHADASPFYAYRMGDPQTDAKIESGILPWWTHPDAKLVFFRPIAEGLMRLDYRLWPDSTALMHLHSIAWYVVLVAIAGFVYARFMPSAMAVGLAAIMFAVDYGHGGAVAWLADRNALVAMTGSMLALLCYTRERWSWLLLGCLFFAVTLGCAEAALAVTGYFFSYEVFLSKRPWSQRILRLLPYALVSVIWLVLWHLRDYGSAGPSFYTDPFSDPVDFLQNVIYRIPAILFSQLSKFPAEILGVFEGSPGHYPMLVLLLLGCGVFIRFLWPLIVSSPQAGFFALGMCIAALPICGVQLVTRSLFYVSFGATGLLALWLGRYLSAQEPPSNAVKGFAVVMLVLHFLVNPVFFVGSELAMPILDGFVDSRKINLPNNDGVDKKLLVLSLDNYQRSIFFPMTKDKGLSLGADPVRPKPSIERVMALVSGTGEFDLTRKDDNTLVTRSRDGFEKMRTGKYGFNRGDVVRLEDVTITIRNVNANRAATEIEYQFKPGILQHYTVVTWHGKQFEPATLPAVGTTDTVNAPAGAS